MRELYHAYALHLCGSTNEVITTHISSAENREMALRLCEEFAKNKRGIMRTWLKKQGRTSEYCAKSYI